MDDRPDFVMLFATVAYPQSVLLQSVREATGQAPLIGCSSAGAIAHNVPKEPYSYGVGSNLNGDRAQTKRDC